MSLFVPGLLAHLPDVAPDAPQFLDGVSIFAADGDDKAKDEPKDEKKPKDAKDKLEPGAEVDGLPKLPLPAPGLGAPSMGMGPGFPVGSRVREKLSGQEGEVVASPPGDFGSIVFVKSEADKQTHPVLSENLELLPMAPAPTLAPTPSAIEPAPDSPIPAADPLKPRASATRPIYRAWLAKKMRKQSITATPKPAAVSTAPQIDKDFLVTPPNDERKILYSALLAQAKKIENPSHAQVLDILGYIPENWDLLVGRLMQDGVLLKSKMEKFDVAEYVRRGLSASEIRLMLGRQGVPMYALDKAFSVIMADDGGSRHRTPEADALEGDEYAKRVCEACSGEGRLSSKDNSTCPACGGKGVKAAIKADKPTKPMPPQDPGQGMTWAWDPSTQDWYEKPVEGA